MVTKKERLKPLYYFIGVDYAVLGEDRTVVDGGLWYKTYKLDPNVIKGEFEPVEYNKLLSENENETN